ncbi:hypothetical protein F5Y09DRAFT_350326 [Xylaria sp. FL1042]|nr:hypothetical protein F5Y09DRAFT_350326 [Xylaria sp. FL1042]
MTWLQSCPFLLLLVYRRSSSIETRSALTRLDGFEFPPESPFTRDDLKDFAKIVIGKSSWRHFTEARLAARVADIFEAACNVFESQHDPVPSTSFYVSVAKKVTRTKVKDYYIFHQIIGTYADGLKKVAARSESSVYVDRRSAPAALSVASWIGLTENKIISITTRRPLNVDHSTPPQQPQRRRRVEVSQDGQDGRNDREAEARETQLSNVVEERDQALRELGKAKTQIHSLTQEIEATKFRFATQQSQLRDAKREVKKRASEWRHAEAKRAKFFKAFKTSQRDRGETIANLQRQYDDRESEYFALAEAQWRDATRELTLVKQERDQSQRTLAECARVIKSLNSKLNGKNGVV